MKPSGAEICIECGKAFIEGDCKTWPPLCFECSPPKICCRCYDIVDELFPANCDEKPEELEGKPLGMYHCPSCGSMVIAGLPHPKLCKRCLDREHPGFDKAE